MEIFEEVKSTLGENENKDSNFIAPFPLLTKNAVESLRYRAEVSISLFHSLWLGQLVRVCVFLPFFFFSRGVCVCKAPFVLTKNVFLKNIFPTFRCLVAHTSSKTWDLSSRAKCKMFYPIQCKVFYSEYSVTHFPETCPLMRIPHDAGSGAILHLSLSLSQFLFLSLRWGVSTVFI